MIAFLLSKTVTIRFELTWDVPFWKDHFWIEIWLKVKQKPRQQTNGLMAVVQARIKNHVLKFTWFIWALGTHNQSVNYEKLRFWRSKRHFLTKNTALGMSKCIEIKKDIFHRDVRIGFRWDYEYGTFFLIYASIRWPLSLTQSAAIHSTVLCVCSRVLLHLCVFTTLQNPRD